MEGGLWQHYAADEDEYNKFYGTNYNSTIKAVLNSDPSTVKTFNTLNYEGSQAYVINPEDATRVTTNNAQAWLLTYLDQDNELVYPDIDGWECTEIKTDLDAGSVVEFIKKEGKWFNYIKGKTVNLNSALDTNRFSVQGVGIVSSIITITNGTTTSSGTTTGGGATGGGATGGGGTGGGGY